MSELSTQPTSLSEPVEYPEVPEYMTGSYVHQYLAACDPSIKQTFDNLCARSGITVANDDKTLKSEQMAIFMEAI